MDVQLSVIGLGLHLTEVEPQRADRLVGHTVGGAGTDVTAAQLLGLGVLPGKEQHPNRVQPCGIVGMHVVMGRATPYALLVELQLLALDAAIDHSTHTAVADGKGLDPLRSGTVVLQTQVMLLGRRATYSPANEGQ